MLDERIISCLFQQYPMLKEIPKVDQEALLLDASLMHIPSGTVIFDELQLCQGFPMLLSGNIRVIKAAQNGRELVLYRVAPGESCILTNSCLLGNTSYHARGVAEQDLELVLLSPGTFYALVARHEVFRLYVFQLFSERLTDLMQLISAVAFQKLDQRLAKLLCNKSGPVNSTHKSISDELGIVREIVSRLLKSFSDQGWIKLGREQIEIIDTAALRRFSEL